MSSIEVGSVRAKELQDSIQRELAVKGWASANDPVMAEFITIMIINSKNPEQITSELKELIGDDYDPEFTNWLFIEAADGDETPPPGITSHTDTPSHGASTSANFSHPPPTAPRARESTSEGLVSQASKRPRSPIDNGPSSRKTPRTSDLPDRPRAMRDEKTQPIPVVEQVQSFSGDNRRNNRSLLERVGPPSQRFGGNSQRPHVNDNNNFRGAPHQQPMFDPVQAQMDVVAAAQMGMAGFPMPMMTVDQMQMQELIQSQAMMLNQMNQMMQQLAAANGGNNSGGFNSALQGQSNQNAGAFGPGKDRGGASRGGGRGPVGHANGATAPAPAASAASAPAQAPHPTPAQKPVPATVASSTSPADSSIPLSAVTATPVVAPQPRTAAAAAAEVATGATPVGTYPERPGTPTLCKFSINCTNPMCRYSHPSPAATMESALVLSNDACEKGNKCDDKDCTKSHVSPATLKPGAAIPSQSHNPARSAPYTKPTFNPYAKPFIPGTTTSIPCKFGANCTRANCAYQHPLGRTTLPGEFHRGLKTTDPTVRLNPAADKARLAAVANVNRYNRTVTFNKPKPAAASGAEATSSNPTPNGGSATTESTPQPTEKTGTATPAPAETASAAA